MADVHGQRKKSPRADEQEHVGRTCVVDVRPTNDAMSISRLADGYVLSG
jgi:hypothetical protein